MQVVDEQKRVKILKAAARLFATQPFHKVLLSDVAEAASVGKGTLYTYFKNKEDLYFSLLYSGFSGLVDCIREQMAQNANDPEENLAMAIRETVRFAYSSPHLFEIMRTNPGFDRVRWDAKRKEFKNILESIICQGVALGLFEDPHPELTARYIPGLVRSALLDGIETVNRDILTAHILRFIKAALAVRKGEC